MSRPHRTKDNASGLGISIRAYEMVAHAQSADGRTARSRSPKVTGMEGDVRHEACSVGGLQQSYSRKFSCLVTVQCFCVCTTSFGIVHVSVWWYAIELHDFLLIQKPAESSKESLVHGEIIFCQELPPQYSSNLAGTVPWASKRCGFI